MSFVKSSENAASVSIGLIALIPSLHQKEFQI